MFALDSYLLAFMSTDRVSREMNRLGGANTKHGFTVDVM